MMAKLTLLLFIAVFVLVESRPGSNLVLKTRGGSSGQGSNSGHGGGSSQNGGSSKEPKINPASPMNYLNMLFEKTLDYLLTEVDVSALLNDLLIGFQKLLSDVQAIIASGEKLFVKDGNGNIQINNKFVAMDMRLITDFLHIVDEMDKNELRGSTATSFRFVDSCLKAFADEVWIDKDQVHNLNTIVERSIGCLKASAEVILYGASVELPKISDENTDKEIRKTALGTLIVLFKEVTDEVAHVSDFVEELIDVSIYGTNPGAALTFAKCRLENLNTEKKQDCEKIARTSPVTPTPEPTPVTEQTPEKRQKILRDLRYLLQALYKKKTK